MTILNECPGFNFTKRFPTKAQMKPITGAKMIPVISNHFSVKLGQSASSFTEWTMTFISIENKGSFLANPESIPLSEIPADSNFLINQVYSTNKNSFLKKLGPTFITGLTLYSLGNISKKYEIFEEHSKYILIVVKKNSNFTLEGLLSNSESNMRPQILRFLNASLKNAVKKKGFHSIDRSGKFYKLESPVAFQSGPHRFNILKGFKMTFDIYDQSRLALLVNYSSKICRSQTAWDEIKFYRKQGLRDEEIAEEYLLDHSVLTIYGSQRTYRIDEILYKGRPTDPFPNTKFKNYIDYFETQYRIKIKDSTQFLFVHHKKIIQRDSKGKPVSESIEKIVLLPDLVVLTGLTDEMRSDFRLMKDLGEHTILLPDVRHSQIVNAIQTLESSDSAVPFQVEKQSNKVNGYQLNPPKILTAGSSEMPKNDRINVNKVAKNISMNNWVFVYEPFVDKHVDTVLDNIIKAAGRYKLDIKEPAVFSLQKNMSPTQLMDEIKKSKRAPNPSMVFFFVGRRIASQLYKSMKSFFNERGIATQFFVSFNPNKDATNLSKFGNLGLQMLTKLGGNIWMIEKSLPNSLVVGADVSNSKKGSVISLTGQFDSNFSKIYSSVRIVKKIEKDIMSGVSDMTIEIVEGYKKAMGSIPKTVVFYRDGASEGQLKSLLDQEVKKIEEKLFLKYGEQKPKLIFIVVNKKIDDFFSTTGGAARNPEGGLIVNDQCVKSDYANFFMVAQKVTQGTARPTHYSVLYNDTTMEMSELTNLTYSLTWNYSNWMGPVKVPSPVQYASKLCKLICLIQNAFVAENLRTVTYFN